MMGQGKDGASPLAYTAPEANAYEFQSGTIIEMLKKLKDEFRDKLATAQKEEMNAAHASEMIIMDLTDAAENGGKEIQEKTAEKAMKSEKLALDQKQLAATTEVKAATEQTLSQAETECSEKALSYAEKQRLRTEEIQAVEKAIEILSSPEVLEVAGKYVSLSQKRKGQALVQIAEIRGEASARSTNIRRKVREFLAKEGERLHSSQLSLLAQKLTQDPFAKVKKLVDEMITRLQLEANTDAKHEGFCDTEMGKSKITRTKLSESIDALDAAIEDGKATIAALTSDTATLSKEVADLEQAMTSATQMRQKEKLANSVTIKDAVAAQNALAAATAVLKDFYAKALTATALLQVKSVQAPEGTGPSSAAVFKGWGTKTSVKFGSEEWKALANPNYEGSVDKGHKEGMQQFGGEGYQGQQDEEEYGVLALLELIQSDFANLEADTKADEAASESAYNEFMTLSKKSKATKDRKIEMNTADQASAEAKLSEDTFDLKATQDQLLAADRYHATLVPQCIDGGMTFEERNKAREEEVASLKQALAILSSEDIATTAL
jgi:DNA uptake protein ComE-like DNA-binding protein